jgi:hypothetical protein
LVRRPLAGLLYEPRMIDDDVWSSRWNDNWQGKPKYSKKACSGATLSTTNPTLPDLGSNLGRRGGKYATMAWPTSAILIIIVAMWVK